MYHLEAWVVVVGVNSLLTGSVDSRRMLLKSVGKKLTFFLKGFLGFTWFLWVPNCLGSFSSFYESKEWPKKGTRRPTEMANKTKIFIKRSSVGHFGLVLN